MRSAYPASSLSFSNLCSLTTLSLIIVLIDLPQTFEQIIVSHQNKFMRWDGCLYWKVRIAEENNTDCYKCTVDELKESIPISITDWPQEFINCTDFCDHATICTKLKYYSSRDSPPIERPLCYQCENRKNEVIKFESKYHHELCSEDCKRCGDMVDLSDAVKCAPICKGLPTFCFPMNSSFGERICYQAKHWYGCDYFPIFRNPKNSKGSENVTGVDSTKRCRKCARQARNTKNSGYCSYACSSYPTYYDGSNFLQCRPHVTVTDKHNDLFLYNVPHEVLQYMHMSNASYLYPAEIMDNKIKYLDGNIARQIYQKFNIGKMNKPLPYKYRTRKFHHELLRLVVPNPK